MNQQGKIKPQQKKEKIKKGGGGNKPKGEITNKV